MLEKRFAHFAFLRPLLRLSRFKESKVLNSTAALDGVYRHLLAILTGLTLAKDDVDRLVEAGRSAILNSAALRDFVNGYAVTPLSNGRSVNVSG